MAIVQSSLTEEILSRQEKAVIRGIYRAQQLSEAMNALQKIASPDAQASACLSTQTTESIVIHAALLKQYLQSAINSALVATKVPAISRAVKETPSTEK